MIMTMNQPSLDELMKKVDSRYSLVVITAKRARELTEKNGKNGKNGSGEMKPVSAALWEIAAGKIKYRSPRGGIK